MVLKFQSQRTKFEGAITESQYNVLSSIKAQYENLLQNAGSELQQEYLKEKLSRLKNLNYMTKLSAQKLISELSNTNFPNNSATKCRRNKLVLKKQETVMMIFWKNVGLGMFARIKSIWKLTLYFFRA